MLCHLTISQFAIVTELELDIDTGLTVITGETGAGKSIMLDALGLALGNRADASMVRHKDGGNKAEINASFDISANASATQWLAERDLDTSESDCILRRVVGSDGRSKGYINGTPQPLSALRELGALLVHIHGQHEHQALMKRDAHRDLLDQFGQLEPLLSTVKTAYTEWQAKQKAFVQHRDNAQELADRADLLAFQLREFDALNLQADEYQTLEASHKKMANADALLSTGQQALTFLSDIETSAQSQTERALSLIQTMAQQDTTLTELSELLESAHIQLQESADSLNRYIEGLSIDPETYQHLDQRLSTAYQLARKHRIDPYTLHEHHQQLAAELESLSGGNEKLEQLEAESQAAWEQYIACAKKLSTQRKKHAKKLNTALTAHINELGMPDAVISLEFHPVSEQQGSAKGLEQVEFIIQTNAGQPAKPLNKIASGGELSRVSLAIQVACAANSNVATLMFDEVDVGIGGSTAHRVGQLLRELGKDNQVICVTHQPQVAAQGHQHLFVSKSSKKNSTQTQIKALSTQDKTAEIARMLGGKEISGETMAHAEAMIAETVD